MLTFLPSWLLGSLTLTLVFLNTVGISLIFFPVAFFKVIIPLRASRRFFSKVLIKIAELWIDINNVILAFLHRIRWEITGTHGLKKEGWYLVVPNHQSWLDVMVLQKALNHKIPFLKFFLKKNLIWLPFLGQAWWAMDMPFMQRYSREFLQKHPEFKGRDLQTTRKACEKFQDMPVSVLNFVEGTRYNPIKHARMKSSYRHLLPPRAGGVAFVLGAMEGCFHSLLDVTIVYPEKHTNLWDLASGRVHKIVVNVRQVPIPAEFLQGDYAADEAFQKRFQEWLNGIWREKDDLIDQLEREASGQRV